jgi:energy-coupling factor transporter ATP-binding protein EcfA2
MSTTNEEVVDVESAGDEAAALFAGALGVADVPRQFQDVGNRTFLKFVVGRQAPIYENALRHTLKHLSPANPFHGLINLTYERAAKFPQSLEGDVLQNIITRDTRHVAQRSLETPLTLSSVAFQNHEDQKLSQPASHLVVGRRGVGKSTLIRRATEILDKTNQLCIVIDMQVYSETHGEELYREVLSDFAQRLADRLQARPVGSPSDLPTKPLGAFAEGIRGADISLSRAIPQLHRLVGKATQLYGTDVFLFLDDYHLLDEASQPELLHILRATLKGACGWLKVAGLRTRLNTYDPATRNGLQIPGDAQRISLDFTLVDPETAEKHLRAILPRFLAVVGIDALTQVMDEAAFRRLVWANAGVPRDFLQMFGRSLEHARRADRAKITLTDVNLSIGEFGQQKMDELERDARNEQNELKRVIGFLEQYCLEQNKVNGFLIRSEQTPEKRVIDVLSDLRLVHMIHQTITPHRAGERYKAYLVDYSLFTGFRRRPRIIELLRSEGPQFKAKELRKIPELPKGFLSSLG